MYSKQPELSARDAKWFSPELPLTHHCPSHRHHHRSARRRWKENPETRDQNAGSSGCSSGDWTHHTALLFWSLSVGLNGTVRSLWHQKWSSEHGITMSDEEISHVTHGWEHLKVMPTGVHMKCIITVKTFSMMHSHKWKTYFKALSWR